MGISWCRVDLSDVLTAKWLEVSKGTTALWAATATAAATSSGNTGKHPQQPGDQWSLLAWWGKYNAISFRRLYV